MTQLQQMQQQKSALRHRCVGGPAFVTVGSILPDIRIIPQGASVGNKYSARFAATLGGAAATCARFGPVNKLPTAVLAAQQAGWASDYCRDLACQDGLQLLLQERNSISPGLSIIAPNGEPGRHEIFTHRLEPPTIDELTPEMVEALRLAKVVLVGPLPWGPATRELLRHLPILAPTAFRAWLPHPSVLAQPDFSLLGTRYHYTQLNFDESRLLDGAANDVVLNARRLCRLVGEENACALTNGARQGLLWISGRWLTITPRRVEVADDTGCGDSFASALVLAWRLLGLSAEDALLYALAAAATTATQGGVRRPLPHRQIREPE
jgi:sugar/nucleoside kinase (ribokinase family)